MLYCFPSGKADVHLPGGTAICSNFFIQNIRNNYGKGRTPKWGECARTSSRSGARALSNG